MTIQEIIDHIPEYKVIATGEICKIVSLYYGDKMVSLGNLGSNLGLYDFDQVQKMTPLSFNGKRIGIGDTVNDWTVYDYYYNFNDDEWVLCTAPESSDIEDIVRSKDIFSHDPLHPSKAKEVTMKEVEEKFGCKVKIIK